MRSELAEGPHMTFRGFSDEKTESVQSRKLKGGILNVMGRAKREQFSRCSFYLDSLLRDAVILHTVKYYKKTQYTL